VFPARSRLHAAKKGCRIIWSAAPADGILAARCRPNGKFGTSVNGSFGQNTSLVVAEEAKDEMGQIRYSLRLSVVDALPPRRRAA
jgi:hypothetical protein